MIMHKAGFVNIVGNPNVGKSTLMNALVGERISIATFKAQTTRHRIMGIYNTDDMQIVFSDTPGVLKPQYKLQESMLNFSTSALVDADLLIYVTDVVEPPDKHGDFISKVCQMTVPVLLLINKIDQTNQEKLIELVEAWKELMPQAEIIPISALTKFNVEYVLKRVKELLPDFGLPVTPTSSFTRFITYSTLNPVNAEIGIISACGISSLQASTNFTSSS